MAVVRDGEIVHLAGYGIANPAGDPVTPQTPFLLASLSKSMTSVAVMQLVEQGLVELDAPIQDYLPWFMPDTPITVRQLLNQTSGLDELDGYERNLDPGGPDGLEQSIRRLAETELNRPPGSAFEYSNSNADTLGLLIQTATGQPYGDTMAANVFAPLGMTHTGYHYDPARTAGDLAVGHVSDGQGKYRIRRVDRDADEFGYGGIHTTVEDLYLWDQNFYTSRIGTEGFNALMLTQGTNNNGTKLGYAFGLDIGDHLLWDDMTRNYTSHLRDELFGRAGVGPADVQVAEIYDETTATTTVPLG